MSQAYTGSHTCSGRCSTQLPASMEDRRGMSHWMSHSRRGRTEAGREHRLDTLLLGTRVSLSSGKTGTLVACSFTRALVELDSGAVVEVAPGAELEVQEGVGARKAPIRVTDDLPRATWGPVPWLT